MKNKTIKAVVFSFLKYMNESIGLRTFDIDLLYFDKLDNSLYNVVILYKKCFLSTEFYYNLESTKQRIYINVRELE